MKAHEYEQLSSERAFWELRLAELQRQHIQLLLIDVNNVDTWERNLKNHATQLAFVWREIKLIKEKLKGEN